MFTTVFKTVLLLLLTTVTCDLIGFNRLKNNVSNHVQTRNLFAPADYRSQYCKWIFENYVAISHNNMWLQDLPTEPNEPTNYRLNRYKRRMASN